MFYGRGSALLQYWRSFEGLERFARDPEAPHMPAWQRFNREARSSGAVGIWHETYIVGRGNYEAIYANMPEFGGRETARRRLMRGEYDTGTAHPLNNSAGKIGGDEFSRNHRFLEARF